jgi:hypothetical protein
MRQETVDQVPPPGFEFVPYGNPELIHACKDLSREEGFMCFIVTVCKDKIKTHLTRESTDPCIRQSSNSLYSAELSKHLNRVGYHFRETIVVEARKSLGIYSDTLQALPLGLPEPIPDSQAEINAQADAAMKELFPRIPNTDRQTIIDHSFNKVCWR